MTQMMKTMMVEELRAEEVVAEGELVARGELVVQGELVARGELMARGELVARGANRVAKEAINVIQGIYSKGE